MSCIRNTSCICTSADTPLQGQSPWWDLVRKYCERKAVIWVPANRIKGLSVRRVVPWLDRVLVVRQIRYASFVMPECWTRSFIVLRKEATRIAKGSPLLNNHCVTPTSFSDLLGRLALAALLSLPFAFDLEPAIDLHPKRRQTDLVRSYEQSAYLDPYLSTLDDSSSFCQPFRPPRCVSFLYSDKTLLFRSRPHPTSSSSRLVITATTMPTSRHKFPQKTKRRGICYANEWG